MKPEASIIIPLYNEGANISRLLEKLCTVLEQENILFEILLIDDGSRDGTFEKIQEAAKADPRIRGIQFRRNHGQTAALMAGFDHAQGDICITMDGDLQHDPKYIPDLLEAMYQGYDLVCSYRDKRNDPLMRRIPSKAANYIARKISRLNIRDFGSTYRAYDTHLVKEIPIYGEMHRFLPIFISMLTNKICEIPIRLLPRVAGKSKYGLGRTFRVFSDLWALFFFSGFFNRPIHIFGYLSILFGLPGFLILSCLSIAKISGNIEIMDYGPLFILGVLLCMVAVQTITTGVVCEYLIRIYYNNEDRRPYSIAKKTFDTKKNEY